jgi:hypothetical protein
MDTRLAKRGRSAISNQAISAELYAYAYCKHGLQRWAHSYAASIERAKIVLDRHTTQYRHCRSELLATATPPLAYQSTGMEEAYEITTWEHHGWHVSCGAVERA